jgi:hypothetical protein
MHPMHGLYRRLPRRSTVHEVPLEYRFDKTLET